MANAQTNPPVDWGNEQFSAPGQDEPAPRSDNDVYAPEPWDCPVAGSPTGSMDHNSSGTSAAGAPEGSMDHAQKINQRNLS